MNHTYDVLIIGGGAAGMMAAITAASRGKDVAIIERNKMLGKKLLITGKGRCNITNFCEVKTLIDNTPTNGRFMTNAFYRFTAHDTITFFENLGVPTKVERGNRVFPESDKALDVVNTLQKHVHDLGVTVIHGRVTDAQKFGCLFAVKTEGEEVYRSKALIIATGGRSYPATGSTGDGYSLARSFGHRLTRFRPSLVPVVASEFIPLEGVKTLDSIRVPALQGVSLRNVAITVKDPAGMVVYREFGEMLFTHFGVSGPIILSATAHVQDVKQHQLYIDLKPALDEKQLDLRLQRDFEKHSRKKYESVLKGLLPRKMIPVMVRLSGIPAHKPVHQITHDERKNLGLLLKNFGVQLEKFRPISEAIITSGGVDVNEIEPKTMQSKLVPGLYCIGELLDVDAYTGGFNLQVAWSSGYCAGNSV
jgi:hypothetical protein